MKERAYVETIMGDTHTPITVFQRYVGEGIGFLLESKSQEKNRFSFIGRGSKELIEGQNREELMAILKEHLDKHQIENNSNLPFVGGAVGIVSYEFTARFFLVREFIAYDHDYGKILFVVVDSDDVQGEIRASQRIESMREDLNKPIFDKENKENEDNYVGKVISNMTKEEFIDKVNRAKDYINLGEASQLVISQRWKVESNIKGFQLYRNLRSLNPSPYLFYYNFGDCQVAGSSPEMLVEIRKDKISTCPIAGTRPRGRNEEEDKILEKELLQDKKELAEHIMLVGLAKEDMFLVSNKGTIKVRNYMKIHKFSHVMHITSLVEGEKRKDIDNLQVLDEFFPAGTLSGSPRKRAMEIIKELEDEEREFYGGAAGHIDLNGDMDMCIAIRMMVIKDNNIYMQAGAGIVSDSDPEKEYEECRNKVRAMEKAIYLGRD